MADNSSYHETVGRNDAAHSAELRRLLRFRQKDGQIWLGEHRAVLLHADYLRGLRRELVDTLGRTRAAGALFRMGFASGKADAALVRSLLPDAPLTDIMRLGPDMHGLEGLVVGRVDRLEMDLSLGRFHAEASWQSSWESEEPFDDAKEPTCYSQTGYASGYITALIGLPVVFKEVSCLSCGAFQCNIVGRPVSDWGAADPWVALLQPDNIGSELNKLTEKVAHLEQRLIVQRSQGSLVGVSRNFIDALALLEKAAPTTVNVLLTGETGVGKEAFARWLHTNGPRSDKPFIAVNCGAIPHELVESELFGVEAGAFTGSKSSRPGRFERADSGTIFLDELGELSAAAQVKLLRVLQEGEIDRLGSVNPTKIDVRVISATNVDLAQAIANKRFRSDLYYRLSAFPVSIPPLRERQADILPLAETFLRRAQDQYGRNVGPLSDMAVMALLSYSWPGNVRELENVLSRSVLLADEGGDIGIEHLGISITDDNDAIVGRDGQLRTVGADHRDDAGDLLSLGGLEDIEKLLIQRALERAKGNVSSAAKLLKISRAKLDYRMKSRNIVLTNKRTRNAL